MDDLGKLTKKDKVELAISTGISAIPYIGGSLNTLYFGAKQERRIKRIEKFYELIKEEYNNIQEKVKDWSNQDEGKLRSLIEEINEGVENDFIAEKIDYFKNCFFNLLTDPSDENYRKRKYFISILNSLSEMDISVIINLYRAPEGDGYKGTKTSEKDNAEFLATLEKLRSFGLVDAALAGSITINVRLSDITHYTISEFGKEFCQFCLENCFSNLKIRTLDEAMEDLLKQYKEPLSARKIAEKVNKNKWYVRTDKKPLDGTQITARAVKKPKLFEIDRSVKPHMIRIKD
ncbi:hypothetical protein [Xanthovirga aplysinae]|uniref:hypothetical protein n=1 Tax=Xanthovirga aplysinae TaxID=2529853 RepID=UPI0012BD575E|nr:hypothetical protein [Xanthovirga aplysinae]MTI29863.1 hypothetical protein [Xanthovirga aplysinae]